jgi:hypothetical protein
LCRAYVDPKTNIETEHTQKKISRGGEGSYRSWGQKGREKKKKKRGLAGYKKEGKKEGQKG